jgi:hypothetical protein
MSSSFNIDSLSTIPSIDTISDNFSVDEDQTLFSIPSLESMGLYTIPSCDEMYATVNSDLKSDTLDDDDETANEQTVNADNEFNGESDSFVDEPPEMNETSESVPKNTESEKSEFSDDEFVEEAWTDSDSDEDSDLVVNIGPPSITCFAFASMLASMTVGCIIVVELVVFAVVELVVFVRDR